MRDTGLYSRIPGLSDPWFVADVALDTARRSSGLGQFRREVRRPW